MRLLGILLLFIAALLPARAVQIRIDSPDKGTIWPAAKPVDRYLVWKEKDQALYAVVTFRDDLHDAAGSGAQEDTLFFRFPGVRLNPDGALIVQPAEGDPIPVAFRRKGAAGNRVLLLETTLVVMSRNRGEVNLALDIDSERTAEKMKKAAEVQDRKDNAETSVMEGPTLNKLIHAGQQ